MKKIFLAAVAAIMIMALAGCGGDNHHNTITTQIRSDSSFDGDILFAAGQFTVTQNVTKSVFAGVDPANGNEYRAFLYFPLTGLGGVPGSAIIDSATLGIFINNFVSSDTIPLRIDLVSFQPPSLIPSDYDLTLHPVPLFITVPIYRTYLGRLVRIDVTPLMKEAQFRGLVDFQIRIMEDLGAVNPGLIEIDETTSADPFLEVTYF